MLHFCSLNHTKMSSGKTHFSTFGQRAKWTAVQSVTAFLKTVNPRKHYPEHFRRYFTTCAEIVERQPDTLLLIRLLFLLLLYWTALQLFFALTITSDLTGVSKLSRVVLCDVVLILGVQPKFALQVYIGYACLALYSLYLHWALYQRAASCGLSILGVEANLVVGAGGWGKRSRKYNKVENNQRRLTVTSAATTTEDEPEEELTESNLTKSEIKAENSFAEKATLGKINPFDSTFKTRFNRVATYRDLDWTLYRKFALRTVNLMQLFTFVLNSGLAGFTVLSLGQLCQQLTSTSNHFIAIFVHLPLFLAHLPLFFAFWASFEGTISFFASYAVVGIVYILLTTQRNLHRLKAELSRTVRRMLRKESGFYQLYMMHRHRRLMAVLSSNLHLFEVIFLADQFYSQLFTTYLAVFVPSSAYCAMGFLLGKLERGVFSFVLLFVVLGNSALGSLAIHGAIAHLSGRMHRGGKVLAAWSARVQSIEQREGECGSGSESGNGSGQLHYRPLPPRLMIHLNTLHISRLLVHAKYGPTYYSMCGGTFFGSCLI